MKNNLRFIYYGIAYIIFIQAASYLASRIWIPQLQFIMFVVSIIALPFAYIYFTTSIVKKYAKFADGRSINNDDMHWQVDCPSCKATLEYTGYFDSSDLNKCKCGNEFKTRRIYFNDGSFIE